jgi:hypothetical protein
VEAVMVAGIHQDFENPFPFAAFADPNVDPPVFVERKDELSTVFHK